MSSWVCTDITPFNTSHRGRPHYCDLAGTRTARRPPPPGGGRGPRSVLLLVPLRPASGPSGYSRPAADGTCATSAPLGADPLLQIPYSGPGQFFVKQHLADLLDLGLRQLQLRAFG